MKGLLRGFFFYVVLAVYLPFHLPYLVLGLVFGYDRMFADYAQTLSLLPGYLGCKIRGAFYYLTLAGCSREVFIEMGTFLVSRECRLGRSVYIGARCIVSYADIGDDVLIGSHVNILSGKHQHTITDVNTPIRLQGGVRTKLTIGEDCWIGNGSIIMANVGRKSVVASGAVVVEDVGELSIMGGNPARLLKKRA